MRSRAARRPALGSAPPTLLFLAALLALPAPRPVAVQAQEAGPTATRGFSGDDPLRAAPGPRRRAWPTGIPASGPAPPPLVPGVHDRDRRPPQLRIGERPRSPSILALGGVLGGAAGFFAGGFLGAWIADETADPGQDLAAVGGFALGGAAGEVLGVALGVHRADRGQGSFLSDLLASTLSGALIVGGAALIDVDGAPAWTLAGVGVTVQVGVTVATEIQSRR
ncbi:MAG TPA: hypothetical protein VLL48_10540 [Longimicrobiales bacterium]|nr:hypothetical protein [Longimicrobiales bacterium]